MIALDLEVFAIETIIVKSLVLEIVEEDDMYIRYLW